MSIIRSEVMAINAERMSLAFRFGPPFGRLIWPPFGGYKGLAPGGSFVSAAFRS